MLDILIIGAGPYGISLAAHAKERGLNYKIVGYPMDFWRNTMPQNMYIRTPPKFVNFSDMKGKYSLTQYSKVEGVKIVTLLPREIFISYSMWFIKKTGIELTRELVLSVPLC